MRFHILLLVGILIFIALSYHGAPDRMLWYLEAAPVLGGMGILCALYRVYRFSDFTYIIIALSFVLMLIGAHYTYSEVPLFNWIRDEWGYDRNHFDRVGHFMQGVVPAVILREIFIRKHAVTQEKWLAALIIISACSGISAFYEIAEMTAAFMVEGGHTIDSFLGLQGDVWDTQKDMVMALGGAFAGLFLFNRWHDGSLKKLSPEMQHAA